MLEVSIPQVDWVAPGSCADMPTIRRSNPGAFETLRTRLKELDGKVAKAGWFETSKYEDGTPVAYIAAIQEFGVHINHPGGTPYKIGPDGRAVFVSKSAGAGLPVTKPHTIVIPPRPFMRPTVDRERAAWVDLLRSGSRSVLSGTTTAVNVMQAIGLKAAGDIAKSITLVFAPPLKASTIARRRNALTNKKTVGLLTKPLVDSGLMLNTVSNTVESE